MDLTLGLTGDLFKVLNGLGLLGPSPGAGVFAWSERTLVEFKISSDGPD
jgi:hypothetical protein